MTCQTPVDGSGAGMRADDGAAGPDDPDPLFPKRPGNNRETRTGAAAASAAHCLGRVFVEAASWPDYNEGVPHR